MASKEDFNLFLIKMREKYLEEFDDKINELEHLSLATIKKQDYKEDLFEIFRIVHTIKGASATLGLITISSVCHKLEDFLSFFTEDSKHNFAEKGEKLLDFLDLFRKTKLHYLSSTSNNPMLEQQADLIISEFTHVDSRKVLIVENSKLMANLIRNQLESLNAVITVSQSGNSAIQNLILQRFDMLITSNAISGINGKSLIAAMKLSEGKNCNIKTILLTSNESRQSIINTMQNLKPDFILEKNNQLIDNIDKIYRDCCQKS